MPDRYVVRALTEDDWEILAAVRLEALKNHPTVYASTHEKESQYSEVEWQGWLTRKENLFFGAFDGDELVSIAGIFPHDYEFPRLSRPVGVMGAVYAKPAYRGQQLAEKVGKACIRHAAEAMPWRHIVVSHCDGNEASRRMIGKLGFRFLEIERQRPWHGEIKDQYWYGIDLDTLPPDNARCVPEKVSPNV